MSSQFPHPLDPAFRPEWPDEDIRLTFYKCVRWQVEETLDPVNCPYHYFCESTYPGNYPPFVDVLVLVFTAVSLLATLVIMVIDISRRGQTFLRHSRRYLLPSGPISLPIIVLALAKGYRINTVFPLSCVGPAILQLIQVCALAFDNGIEKDLRYAFFEASTMSGILHASLYLDGVIMPYYTGYDALVSSTFSGECHSCVCRREALTVGGKLVSYRGWSTSTFLVVGAVCARIICRLPGENRCYIKAIKCLFGTFSWISITVDCIYLLLNAPQEESAARITAFGGILILICFHFVKTISSQILKRHTSQEKLEE